MAINMFLQLDGITGESADADFPGWIKLEQFSFAGTQTSSVTFGTGSGAGKVSLGPITVTKQPDEASATLFLCLCSGRHINTGTLALVKAGAHQAYLTLKMTQVFITSFNTNSSGEIPAEVVGFSYAKLVYEYMAQTEQGDLVSKGVEGWDLTQNKAAA